MITLDSYNVWKAKVLIKMLITRGINPERALENYPRAIYDEAKKELLNNPLGVENGTN